MKKVFHYLFWLIVYLGLCLLCDTIFEDKFTGTLWETVIRALTFLIAIVLINYTEKKGWNSWSKVKGIFKRKK